MKRVIQSTIRFLFVTAALIFGGILPSFAADLQMFSNARLINDPANDGDSFLVEANGKPFHVRLYFVDCPETLTASISDAQRVREQTRYFGLSDAARTIHFIAADRFTAAAELSSLYQVGNLNSGRTIP